jgi:hypothetical protein
MRRPALFTAAALLSLWFACSDDQPSGGTPDAAGDYSATVGRNPGTNLNDPADDWRDGGARD